MLEFNATLLLVLVSFLIFMGLMKSIYFDPVARVKQARQNKLAGDQKSAQDFLQDLDHLKHAYEAGLAEARAKAQQVIADIRRKAKASAGEAIHLAREDARTALDIQMAEMHRWQEEAYQELSQERPQLAKRIIQKITAEKSSEKSPDKPDLVSSMP